jgi:hypothetical protein
MRNALLVALTLLAAPAYAQTAPVQHDQVVQEQKQETVALGDNRFLIFSGSPGPIQYIYSVDIVKIDGGIPHFEPIFMEDYDIDTNSYRLSEGAAFPATSYHFDKATGSLSYTAKDTQSEAQFQYSYHLDTDIFKLQGVLVQETPATAPKSLFKAP